VGKAYTLFGATQLECDEWMEAISRAIERLNLNQTVTALFFSFLFFLFFYVCFISISFNIFKYFLIISFF
jgi:hypothetical protein